MIQIISSLGIIFAWMLGGQWEKAIRRYGISAIIISLIIWRSLNDGIWFLYTPLVFLFPELFLGYGTGSWAAEHFKKEWLIRFMYALALAIPISLCGLLQDKALSLLSFPILIASFQIRAGSLFHIGKKDFLIEDFFRSLALSTSLWLSL